MNKEQVKKEAKSSIDEIFAKIDELEAKKDKAEGNLRTEYEEKLNDLKSRKSDLQEKYNELINASDEKWDEVKKTFSSATDSFKEGLSKISTLI